MAAVLTRRGIVVLFAACLACLMFGLEISSVPTILPTLEQVLDADFKQLQWVMNAYTIAVTTVLMAVGAIADRYGRKRVFLVSIGAFGLASLICGLANDISTLILARFLQGLSGGAMLICQLAVLSHEFQEGRDKRKRDVTNLLKAPEDLLVKHGIIEADDGSIVRRVEAFWTTEVEGVRITIEATV